MKMKEWRKKYKDEKDDGKIGKMKWKDLRKDKCGDDDE